MLVDYELNWHYDISDDFKEITQHGFTIKFNSDRVLESVREKYGIIAQKHTLYRFEDSNLYKLLIQWLTLEENDFIGVSGSDDWVLYVYKYKKVDYWDGLYGEGFIKNKYPVWGKELWNNCEELVIINHENL